MLQLVSMIYGLVASTLAGGAVVGALLLRVDHLPGLLSAAALGGALALPASLYLAWILTSAR